ncbi:MAG: aminopeptidase P family protein [Candidatus Aminicenantes bacterium]|nr:aminopeptidase P family protein [Candidatus Aminicenantes bacterium]
MSNLIKEKINQAIQILQEEDIDCWLTLVRESGIVHDPMLDFLIEADVTWLSAFIITRTGESIALVGQMDRATIEELGVYSSVLSYVQGIKELLLSTLQRLNPRQIAVNFSEESEICDGLTHGLYLKLVDYLKEINLEKKIISAQKVISRLRARKTPTEMDRIKRAIVQTEEIFSLVTDFIKPGRTEREIADFMIAEVHRRGLGFAWERSHCPAVFTGPETAEAHYRPTDRQVEPGHILNMDFGVEVDGYVSDLQRTFYIRRPGEEAAPPEVSRGFQAIVTAIELARQKLKPGIQGVEVDRVAREYLVSQGYEEFPHALGHQVGRFAHDGTALLGPAWEKYAGKPFEVIEPQMVFTLEPRLKIEKRGIVTIEEMVVVTPDGAEFLSTPQKELILI